MPRSQNDMLTSLEISLPTTWRARLDLQLYSPLEGRVPKGAYSRFFLDKLIEHFNQSRLDLSQYGVAGTISGPPETIKALQDSLAGWFNPRP